MKSFLGSALLPAAASDAPLSALADPAAPSGWRASPSADSNIYRPSANPGVELRACTDEERGNIWFEGHELMRSGPGR